MLHESEVPPLVQLIFVPDGDEALEDVLANATSDLWGPVDDLHQYLTRIGVHVQVEPWPALEERAKQDREAAARGVRSFVVPEVPLVIRDAVVAITSSGLTASVLAVFKTWVDARNGRKLKIKVGDIEVEATQMKEEDVLRIFELLEEKADRKKIRELLLKSGSSGEGGQRRIDYSTDRHTGKGTLAPHCQRRREGVEALRRVLHSQNRESEHPRCVRAGCSCLLLVV